MFLELLLREELLFGRVKPIEFSRRRCDAGGCGKLWALGLEGARIPSRASSLNTMIGAAEAALFQIQVRDFEVPGFVGQGLGGTSPAGTILVSVLNFL